ncbi:SLATT domain-containing protein [Allosphingosinicella humi]
MSSPDPNGKIYLTAKARMVAESRLKSVDTVSQILMAWYSVCIITLSVLDLSQSFRVRDVSVMTIILAVGLLAMSIFLPGRNFSVRAAGFRDCYLKLQKIYWSATTPEEKADAYGKTLPLFENHSQRDYEWVLFHSRVFGKPLADSEGEVVASNLVIVKCAARAIIIFLIVFVLFASPLAIGYMLVIPR